MRAMNTHRDPLDAPLARAQLQALNHRCVHTFAAPDPAFAEALIDPDFRWTASNGAWVGRAGHLAHLQAPALIGAWCEHVRVRLYGPAALVQGTLLALRDGAAAAERLRYSDVYLHRATGWRLVNRQHTPLPARAVVPPVNGYPPAADSWPADAPDGGDPDSAALKRLNEQYVQAYRDADVAWYGEHLAHDYTAVQGDGTLSSRAAALARFAKDAYTTHMREFPVHRVSVRGFGELALIHAENAYTLKDGRKGVSRYTDIWHRREGRWRCVSAHITEHRAPA